MTLHRLKLLPRSPWRTPWQADTLTGMLLATCARVHGPDVLRDRLIEPMLAAAETSGGPPFVLSDACPGDLLPVPIWFRLADWPALGNADRKKLKRARWLAPEAFHAARAGVVPSFDQLIADDAIFLDHARHHNTLSRLTDTTAPGTEADSGLAPFSRAETLLRATTQVDGGLRPNPALSGADYMSIYFRILAPDAADLFLDLMHELSLTGFGADVATGRGQFDILGDPEPMPELDAWPPISMMMDDPIAAAAPSHVTNTGLRRAARMMDDPIAAAASSPRSAVICLSTFQPGSADPTDGLWDAFHKFGKLGPELASLAGDHRKNTLILFRPGACFRIEASQITRGFLGRAVPMNQLLPTAADLEQRGFNIIHPAFGLTLPAHLHHE